ncbi:MAG: formate/nitrite transporter family protein [Gemmiger sp.]
MYTEVCTSLAATAAAKAQQLRTRPAAFFVSSALAGAFIALGSVVFLSTGGALTAAGYGAAKFLAGLVFSAALSLVVMAGSDLFTGSNLTIGVGVLERTVSPAAALSLWAVCWLGNLAGSWLVAGLFHLAGLTGQEAVAAYLSTVAAGKLSAGAGALFLKGVLCNFCVCLAVWCVTKMKSESGKLIMIVWCILVFMLCGFEHSIANMSILGLALLSGAGGATPGGYCFNLFFVTLGNLAGGFFLVALPYWFLARQEQN